MARGSQLGRRRGVGAGSPGHSGCQQQEEEQERTERGPRPGPESEPPPPGTRVRAAHGARAGTGRQVGAGAHGPMNQGRRRMIRGGRVTATHSSDLTWVTAPGADGARLPAPWGSAPGHRPRGGGCGRAHRPPPGTGVRGISRGPPRHNFQCFWRVRGARRCSGRAKSLRLGCRAPPPK